MEYLLDQILIKYSPQKILVVGIDGLGGSGKSTIVNSLKQLLQNNNYKTVVLHIDDFINKRDIRYNISNEEWYCYYNIQWRYDYLIKEILYPIKKSTEIDKQIEIYDKENDTYYLEHTRIPIGSILLLEGVFLQRKEVEPYLDYIIYIQVPKDVRLSRVICRDKYIGDIEDIKLKYEKRYFPAEDKYIKEYSPAVNADLIINNI